jgi:flagellar capping protein FliD
MTLADTSGTPLGAVGVLTGSSIKNELQIAQNAELYADGILDQTNLNYETDFQTSSTVQVGSAGTLTFAGGASGSVAYSATDSLATLAANITSSITGASAAVVSDGAGVRLEITGAAAFTFSETGGGTAITDLGIDNARKVITRSSNTIDDLFTGVTLSLFAAEQGTTVSLDIEQDLSQVKTEIFSFVESYNAMRQYVNGNRLFDSATGELDEDTGVLAKSQALSTVSSQLSQIIGVGVTGVDPAYSVLSQIGIDFVDITQEDPLLAENLEIDETVLDSVLLSNPDDVRKLFNFDLTSSDPRITLLNFTGDTQFSDTGYSLNVQPSSGENLLLYSEQADNAYWTATRATVSADAIIAPDNTTTAEGLVADATNDTHFLSTTAGESFTSGENYIFSTYVRAGDRNNARIAFNGAAFGGGSIGADFDLAGGTVQSTDAGVSDSNIEDVGNGWYRVSIKATATATGTANLERYSKDTTTTFTGDGATVSTYFWGAQMEGVTTETTPGGYLPTTAAAVTGVTASANINGTADGADDGSASISGNVITVNTGGAQGLQLFFNGLDLTSTTQLDLTVGVGAQMYFKLGELLDVTTGIVDAEIDELTGQNTLNNERITEMLDRLEIQRQNLLERYIAMETAISSANNIMDSLAQTVDSLSSSNS